MDSNMIYIFEKDNRVEIIEIVNNYTEGFLRVFTFVPGNYNLTNFLS